MKDFLIYLIFPIILGISCSPQVKIEQGELEGKYEVSERGIDYSAFMGIPFAQPPVGDLRFKAPVASSSWEGILQVIESKEVCPQIDLFSINPKYIGNEDCLYLNIYTPWTFKEPISKPKAVMIYLFGGGFFSGSPYFEKHNPKYIMDYDVILVTPNYRLGPLGFLSTGDDVLPGNNGLRDQQLAIRWVSNNIEKFGGDPKRITLFGESAGAASVHFQMLSPSNKGLIYAGISQSGTALSPWALLEKDEARQRAVKLAKHFNCSSLSNSAMINCLRTVDAEDIITAQHKLFYKWRLNPAMPFRPVVEGNVENAFLPDRPENLMKSGETNDIPYMLGITSEEGAMISIGIFSNPKILQQFNEDSKNIFPVTLLYDEINDTEEVTNNIRNFYFDNKIIENNQQGRTQVTNMYTDRWFMVSTSDTADLHFNYNNKALYYYIFGYRGTTSYASLFDNSGIDYGVSHADDLLYIFDKRSELLNYVASDNDLAITDNILTLWTTFAKTGNPNPMSSNLTVWSPVQTNNIEYYHIKRDATTEMSKNPYWSRYQFWKSLSAV